jgi:ankyrin repeat protein
LARGAAANLYGSTSLHIAVALLLLESGAALETRDANGRAPLFEAISSRQDELIEAMVRREIRLVGESSPFDVNVVANDGTTLLIVAVESGLCGTVCTAGADSRVPHRPETAHSIAERKGMTAVSYDLRVGARCTASFRSLAHVVMDPTSSMRRCRERMRPRIPWEVVAR